MGKSFPLVAFLFLVWSLPVYGANQVTLPPPPPIPGPFPLEVHERIPVANEPETYEAGGVDVRAVDEGGILDAEEIEIVPPNAWSFQFKWSLDHGYWRELCRFQAHGLANSQSEFMEKFPFSLFGDALSILEDLDGETVVAKFAGPVTLAPGVVLDLSVPDTVQTIFSMIRALNGVLIILFGSWSLAHKFISFGGGS